MKERKRVAEREGKREDSWKPGLDTRSRKEEKIIHQI